MSNAPLMPMATAVWLVENTTLTFKQIANFCRLHEVEIQGIADGEFARAGHGADLRPQLQFRPEEHTLIHAPAHANGVWRLPVDGHHHFARRNI